MCIQTSPTPTLPPHTLSSHHPPLPPLPFFKTRECSGCRLAKVSGVKYQSSYYISQFHGLRVQAGLRWIILPFPMVSMKLTQWQPTSRWACVGARDSPIHWSGVLLGLSAEHLPTASPVWQLLLQSLSQVQFFATSWTAALQSSLSFTISQSSLRLMSIESGMPSKPSRPLSPSTPPALNLSQHQSLFQWVGSSYQVAKVLKLQDQSLG